MAKQKMDLWVYLEAIHAMREKRDRGLILILIDFIILPPLSHNPVDQRMSKEKMGRLIKKKMLLVVGVGVIIATRGVE